MVAKNAWAYSSHVQSAGIEVYDEEHATPDTRYKSHQNTRIRTLVPTYLSVERSKKNDHCHPPPTTVTHQSMNMCYNLPHYLLLLHQVGLHSAIALMQGAMYANEYEEQKNAVRATKWGAVLALLCFTAGRCCQRRGSAAALGSRLHSPAVSCHEFRKPPNLGPAPNICVCAKTAHITHSPILVSKYRLLQHESHRHLWQQSQCQICSRNIEVRSYVNEIEQTLEP